MTHVAKIVEIIGTSDKGWKEAAQVALDEAKDDTWIRDYRYDSKSRSKFSHDYSISCSRKISFGVEH